MVINDEIANKLAEEMLNKEVAVLNTRIKHKGKNYILISQIKEAK